MGEQLEVVLECCRACWGPESSERCDGKPGAVPGSPVPRGSGTGLPRCVGRPVESSTVVVRANERGPVSSFRRRKDPEAAFLRNFRWDQLPPSSRPFTFDAPSGPLATVEWGASDGTPVLLAPGITGSKEDFSLVGPALAARGYRVWALDLAGQYQSHQAGPGLDGEWSDEMHLQDLVAVLEAMGGAHFVGYSYAGIVGRKLLLQRPDLLRSVFFLSVPPVPGNVFAEMTLVGGLLQRTTPKVAAAAMLAGIRLNASRVTRTRHRFAKDRLELTVRGSIVGAMDDMLNVPDLSAQLATSGVPLMVGAGAKDMWSLCQHREHAEQIGAQFRSYTSGHAPSETAPKELVRDLAEFFRKVDSEPAR